MGRSTCWAAWVLAAAVAVTAAPAGASAPSTLGGPHVVMRSTIGAPVAAEALCSGAVEGVRSEAMPLVGVDPADPHRLQATWSAHGERLQMVGTSLDGGRTWTAEPIDDATSCAGGPSARVRSTNVLFDVGAGGAAYVGESWMSAFAEQFGVVVHRVGSGRPGGEPVGGNVASQNVAVVADAGDPERVAVAWGVQAQNEIRFAESYDGGRQWSPYVVIHRASAGELAVNPRLVRTTDGGYVLLVDQGRLVDLPGAQLRLSDPELTFYARRSDDGRVWSDPVALGSGKFYDAERPDEGNAPRLAAVKPDLASGAANEVVATWHDVTRTTVRIARSADGGRTWSPAQDTVTLPGLPYQVAVAIDGRGTMGLFWYDLREDRVGDDVWTLRPWMAVLGRDGMWRDSPLDGAFDLAAAQTCTAGPLPEMKSCSPDSHAGPLGVYQDVEGLDRGFGMAYTVSGALAQDGVTDAKYARVAPGGRAG